MSHDQWQSTSLWQQLLGRESAEASELRTALKTWMPDIERILVSGGTSPKDFTLHDADHSYRVAEWMVKLLPEGMLQKLSDFELVLLLLSAYLHDIGMTPEVDNVRRHRDFLLSGKAGLLSEAEAKLFQRWLDDAGYTVVPPLPADRPLDEVVSIADEIITYYTRHRHNDWSEAWIRLHLKDAALGSYTGWLPDLIRLCRSHHEGYEVLAGKEFNPRRVGSPAQVMHLRYLAVLLRVADILDVDPERTPEVIFHHRDIAESSQIYWSKDAHLSIGLIDGRLTATARPPRAYLHRAVEETIDGIERELTLSRKLDDETRFEKIGGPGADLPHRWTIHPSIYRDVAPRDHAYEYINGAFRPNTRRLLDLLSGTALYGNQLAAVRELLQNAFDAVRELIAYQRLNQPNPAQQELSEALGRLLSVEITLEVVDGRIWLVCRDDGIGMTKEIIANHFLVSGSPVRSQILALERQCAQAGFALGRTGQFGIGALSYFMLADRLVIITRRASESGDFEPRGWRFESSGIGMFGELREDLTRRRGTEVRLRLKPQILADGTDDFAMRLAEYNRSTVIHTPCILRIASSLDSTERVNFAPGWTLDVKTLSQGLQLDRSGGYNPSLILPSEKEWINISANRWREVSEDAKCKLEWHTHSGELPNNLGHFRFSIPYYRFSDGVCLAYVIVREQENNLLLFGDSRGGKAYTYKPTTISAWKGMQCTLVNSRTNRFRAPWNYSGIVVELDFRSPSAGEVTVDRAEFMLSPRGKRGVHWLDTVIHDALRQIVFEHRNSAYAFLNARIANVECSAENAYWVMSPTVKEGSDVYWTWTNRISPQIPYLREFRFHPILKWQGMEVYAAAIMQVHPEPGLAIYVSPPSITHPDRVVAYLQGDSILPIPMWTGGNLLPVQDDFAIQASFPPEWLHICGINSDQHGQEWLVWNAMHPIVQLAAIAPAEAEIPSDLESFVRSSNRLKEDPALGAAWLLTELSSRPARLVKYLIEIESHEFREIFQSVFSASGTPDVEGARLALFFSSEMSGMLRTFSASAYEEVLQTSVEAWTKIAPLMPTPTDPEWLLSVE